MQKIGGETRKGFLKMRLQCVIKQAFPLIAFSY